MSADIITVLIFLSASQTSSGWPVIKTESERMYKMDDEKSLKKALKEEKGKLKDMSFKDKLWYIGEYYKFHIIFVIVAVIIIVSVITTVRENSKDEILNVVILNENVTLDTDALKEDFGQFIGFDSNSQRMFFDSSMYLNPDGSITDESAMAYQAKLVAMVAAKQLDVMIAPESLINMYSRDMGFMDLEEALPDELFQKLTDEDRIITAKDADGNTYAAAIDIGGTRITETAGFSNEHPYFSILINSGNLETVLQFLTYAFES